MPQNLSRKIEIKNYDRLRDRFLISDPGLFRLRSAVRGTLTVVLSTAALFYLSSYGNRPFLLSLVGALMAMTGALSTDDRTIREQKITSLWLSPIAAIAMAVGALVLPYRTAAVALLLIFTYFAIDLRKYGPRWNTIGGIAYMSYFAALFFKVPTDQMEFVLAGIFVSGAFSYVIKFYVIPDRAQSAIAWSLSAYRAGIRRFVRAARRELATRDREKLRPRIVRVNELALLSDDAILNASDAMPNSGALVRALQGRLFDLELSARKIFEAFDKRSSDVSAADLDLLEQGSLSLKAGEAKLVAEEEAASPPASLSPTIATVTGVAKVRYTALHERLHFQTRQAIQATLATALATVIGTAISADRWYWAPLTAYVIFTGTTRGDSLRRAFHRLLGTACGVAAGLTLAHVLHGQQSYELTALFLAMFFGIFAIKVSYGWYAFFITTLIALFYSLLGLLTPGLLYLRIEQTLVGGLCGAVCAFLVLPISAKATLRQELAKLFAMLANDLNAGALSQMPKRERRIRVRALERELLTLRAIAGPLKGPLGRPAREETRIVVHGAAALVHFARQVIIFYPDQATNNEGDHAEGIKRSVKAMAIRAQRLAISIPGSNFVDIADALTGGATGETWASENPQDPESPTYSVMRLSQSISAFETRFPPHS